MFEAILSIFIVLAAPADAAPKHEKAQLVQSGGDISGVYLTTGVENEKPYQGVTILRMISGNVYMYHNITGQTVCKGVALRNGDYLSISFSEGNNLGVSSYNISRQTFEGRWTADGNVHREKMRLVSRFEAGE